jgi:DNA mismatch endonuclease (patch repair protein)
MDVFSVEKRSDVMSKIRSAGTKPERTAKATLWTHGFRYTRSDYCLPGKPDIVLPKYHSVIFVHGCFWHGHACRNGKTPKSNQQYWVPKIANNKLRDRKNIRKLRYLGWHCFQVWECSLARDLNRVMAKLRCK